MWFWLVAKLPSSEPREAGDTAERSWAGGLGKEEFDAEQSLWVHFEAV